jgi:hypothetical protein
MEGKNTVVIFLDENPKPLGRFEVPINFDLDTTKLVDGEHKLKIIGKDPYGKEGIRYVNFIVRNGPAIDIEGISENAVVDGVIPLMINAYGKGGKKQFLIDGSETPKSIPSWFWAGMIIFLGWAVYYLVTSLT